MTTPTIRIVRLRETAKLPSYETAGSAGADLSACIDGYTGIVVEPHGGRALIPTGLSVAIPPGWEIQIRPRSGLSLKKGIGVLNSPGTIDADYRGEIGVILVNTSDEPFTVQTGDRIAQMKVAPAPQAIIVEVETLDETARGTGGFGSTGV